MQIRPSTESHSDLRDIAAMAGRSTGQKQLAPEELKVVQELKKIDMEVRRHEQAHLAAAAGNARGGAKFSYTTGPDGRRYAVGGEVAIDTSPVAGNPQATLRKAQAIKRAALAPARPSGQDRAVAAQADGMRIQAERELSSAQSGQAESPDAGQESGPAHETSSAHDPSTCPTCLGELDQTDFLSTQGKAKPPELPVHFVDQIA